MIGRRLERVASLLRAEIATIVTQELNDPALGFVTITEVQVAPDLRAAKVSVSVVGEAADEARAMAVLRRARKHIQAETARRVRLRTMPSLAFQIDDGVKKSVRIAALLRDLAEERDERGPDGEDAP